ncbi:MAG TPA: hypothetical protein VFT61_08595 [Sphingomicrobium sp.]|nr:hypothetical protein [Sphingomicrobium sp.]
MAIRSRQPGRLTFSGFSTTDYPGLNGVRPLSVTKLEIERSILMVGYPTARDSRAIGGPWRARLLSALVEGYLTPTLATTRYFRALEPSERVSMTFLLAQAFTHWVADTHMQVPILIHVSGTSNYSVAATTSPGKPGAGTQKNKSRPDFFGIAAGEFHVFESKGRSLPAGPSGRSASVANALLPSALAQVSRVATVNGMVPKTRTAAAWIFRQSGSHGFVQDPPSTAIAYDVTFDVTEALLRYYRLILDASVDEMGVRGKLLIRVPLDEQRTLFVDRKLRELLHQLEQGDLSAQQFLEVLAGRRENLERMRRLVRRSSLITMGLDGVGLMVTEREPPWRSPVEEEHTGPPPPGLRGQ